jgi:hypothetical protein
MAPTDQTDEDRRATVRHKSLKGAAVVFNDRNSVVTGLVRNLSEAGAKFVVNSPVELPYEVVLRFSDGEEYNAEVTWQKGGTEFGLRFLDGRKG